MNAKQASALNNIVRTIPIALAACTIALHVPGLVPGAGPGSAAGTVSALTLALITLVRRQCEEYFLGVMVREKVREMEAAKAGRR